ncbi:hypothetical protein TEA_002001 [Camellia sinensis var. sinensis]|uniref:Uncharacterized protein n=1 Tax=Camellia sinensis var. sinensis TaxID=542762 RepID=A0A4S4EDV0_CAMSN|nr:hypothetical protein TEA_002001 [Camellia sinensis var. sinensis]
MSKNSKLFLKPGTCADVLLACYVEFVIFLFWVHAGLMLMAIACQSAAAADLLVVIWKVVASFEGNFPTGIKQMPLDRHFDLNNVKRIVLEANDYQPYLISFEKAMIEIKKQYVVFDAKVLSKISRGPLKDKKRVVAGLMVSVKGPY